MRLSAAMASSQQAYAQEATAQASDSNVEVIKVRGIRGSMARAMDV